MTARAHDHDRAAGHDHHDGDLVPVEEAQQRILSAIRPLLPTRLPLREAFGCVLAEDVTAPGRLPSFPSSAMDGFAVRADDVAGANGDRPVRLRIAGEVRMGRAPDAAVGAGQAVAVPTGGAIPDGADCVVPVEQCVVEGDRVLVLRPEPSGRHVRPAGEDVGAGDVLVPRGRRLLGPDLGLLASAGLATAPVHPRPRAVVVSTGDELVAPGLPAAYGQVYDANGFTLDGAVREAGAVPVAAAVVPDDPRALVAEMARHRDGADVFISSGGVSVGDRDPVKGAFLGHGDVDFFEVAMQPGKPQAFGSFAGLPFFGLPGNPVSVFVSFEVFVRPALLRMMGRSGRRPEVTATLETELRGPAGKTMFARVRLRRDGEGWAAAATGGRQSNLLSTVSRADGLAVVPAGVVALSPGDACRVIVFREPPEDP